MSILQEGNFGLRLPERLVASPQDWKVLGILAANSTVFGDPDELFRLGLDNGREPGRLSKTPSWGELTEFALIVPQEPGTSFLTTGFHMVLAEVDENNYLSTTNAVSLLNRGVLGFIVGGVFSIMIDNPSGTQDFSRIGFANRVALLKKAVDKHRENITREASINLGGDWDKAAMQLAPFLAAFCDIRPEWELQNEQINSKSQLLESLN